MRIRIKDIDYHRFYVAKGTGERDHRSIGRSCVDANRQAFDVLNFDEVKIDGGHEGGNKEDELML
jgi:hypothetical protein